jgi:dUTP pyrophosphatase
MKFLKTRDVKSPNRGTSHSAGIDLFVPNDFDRVTLNPGQRINIPSGIKMNVPENHALVAFNKSGVATKKGLVVGACVIDSDYTGEIGLHVINSGVDSVTIEPGDKLLQVLLLPIHMVELEECHSAEEVFMNKQTERGEGGYGSTGDK